MRALLRQIHEGVAGQAPRLAQVREDRLLVMALLDRAGELGSAMTGTFSSRARIFKHGSSHRSGSLGLVPGSARINCR